MNWRMKNENSERRRKSAVSPVIGVILMVSITVIVAATVGVAFTGIVDSTTQVVDEPAVSGVTFDYEYDEAEATVTVSVKNSGNVERLYVDRDTGFNDDDILRTSGGWMDETADRDSTGVLVDGDRIVNEDVGAADTVVIHGVTSDDELTLIADKGPSSDAVVIDYWETES